MPITVEFVDNLFKNLSNGNGDAFFTSVADDVNWTVMGTHPLAGVYNSKADFLKSTFERLSRILKGGVILKVTHIFVSGDIAVVEMTSTSTHSTETMAEYLLLDTQICRWYCQRGSTYVVLVPCSAGNRGK